MTIEEGNKLIAEFMGAKYREHPMKHLGNENEYIFEVPPCEYFSMNQFSEDRLHYHRYWDWLMPVVEKICEIDNEDDGSLRRSGYHDLLIIHNTSILCHKKEVYNRVIQFIQWYNQKQ